MRMRSPLPRRIVAAVLMVQLTACYNWEPTAVSPQQLIPAQMPSSVRATLSNGETYTFDDPTMRNDTIFGVTDVGVTGVAAEDVALFEVSRFSAGDTFWGVSGLVSLVGLIIAAATQEGFWDWP